MSRNAIARPAIARPVRLPLGEEEPRPTFRRERSALKRGTWPVAGCDEAGRGPLAGPVVAAAVILDPRRIPRGLDDSKKLTREAREALYAKICAVADRLRQHSPGLPVGARTRGRGAPGEPALGVRRRMRPYRGGVRMRSRGR